MTPDEADLVDSVLGGFTEIEGVPPSFEQHVRQQIATRPSPTAEPSQLGRIEAKLDRLLTLLEEQ